MQIFKDEYKGIVAKNQNWYESYKIDIWLLPERWEEC